MGRALGASPLPDKGGVLEIDRRASGVTALPAGRLLFAQITDIHIGYEPDNPSEANQQRLDAVLGVLVAMDPQPAFLLATGDLVEGGSIESYQRLRRSFDALPFPVYCCLGNHDKRGPFSIVFPETPTFNGAVQYALDDPRLRILVLDSMSEERHGGDFDAVLADWLDAELTAHPQPTVIAMHHPPTPSGIDWLTAGNDEPWVRRLRMVVEKHHDTVVAIIGGHYHRPMMTSWSHTPICVCPSVAPRVALELSEMNVEHPDDRPMIVDEPPAFALHQWADGGLTTHIGMAGGFRVLARHNEGTKALVRGLIAERNGPDSHAAAASLRG